MKKIREKNNGRKLKFGIALFTVLLLVFPAVSSLEIQKNDVNSKPEIETQNQPELVIEEVSGGFGVTVVITNVGDEAANDVFWSIELDGSFILVGGTTSCPVVIPSLPAGESIVISSWDDQFTFGFGRTNIDVMVRTDEGLEIDKTVEGFAFGFYIGVTEE